MFRDDEVAFVYVYEKRDGTFCVPIEGLETLIKYLKDDHRAKKGKGYGDLVLRSGEH